MVHTCVGGSEKPGIIQNMLLHLTPHITPKVTRKTVHVNVSICSIQEKLYAQSKYAWFLLMFEL